MTVKQAKREIDADEFVHWLAYDKIDPIGPIRGDYQSAMIQATIANSVTPKGKSYVDG